MNTGKVYVIGAGMAGLSAAVSLARHGVSVEVIEAAAQAGGRCRSYYDPQFDAVIDNGNHVVLSGNRTVFDFLKTIGAADRLMGPHDAAFPFMDIRTGERWSFRPNAGSIPWWVFAKGRRVPRTSFVDYWPYRKLLHGEARPLRDVLPCKGPVWEKLIRPVLLAALNTEPEASSARLAEAVISESLAKGGTACRPRIAMPNLSAAFIDPALRYLSEFGTQIHFGQRVRRLRLDNAHVSAIEIGDQSIALSENDALILAVPPWIATELLPDIAAPNEFREIANAHFRCVPPSGAAPMTALIGGTAEWVFAFPDRISVTISAADALSDLPRIELAARIWSDVAALYDLNEPMPVWQIVRERRATFAATPKQAAKRPGTTTRWQNLTLAGDWTDTGLPATIEGAVRSGYKAAEAILNNCVESE